MNRSSPIWVPSLCLGGAGCPTVSLDPFSPVATGGGGAAGFAPSAAIFPSPAQAQVQLQQLILVTLGPKAGAGQPGSWPQLAGEPGLDSVIRRKPEPGHKL